MADRRIVDERVEAPVAGDGAVDEPLDLRLVAQVGDGGLGLAADGADRCHGLREPLGAAGGEHDAHAGGGQLLCHRATDAGRRSRDHGHAARERRGARHR